MSSGKGHFHDRKTIICHNCRKPGHTRQQCWHKKEANQTNKNIEDSDQNIASSAMNTAFNIEQKNEQSIKWQIDPGATVHLVNNLNVFTKVSKLSNNILINVAKANESLKFTHIGSINILLDTGENATIENVMFVKDLRHNLLSVKKLEKAGLDVVFSKGNVSIYKNNRLITRGIKNDNSNFNLWHCRLGHLSSENMRKLCNNVIGFDLNKNSENIKDCETCILSKSKRLPFKRSVNKRSTRVLELIHSDVCGPISPPTFDGKNQFVTFIDDFTHFAITYLIENKSDVVCCFREYYALVAGQFNTKIHSVCTDNGGEYCSHEFISFCKANGIIHKTTIPYNPELNGTAERFNRTLLEKSRAMILQSKLPKEMWGEAILCATYITNRSPTVFLNDRTPSEMFHNKRPNLEYLRVFGSVAYNHIPEEKQKGKFYPKANTCIMVGYTNCGYRLQDFVKRKVIAARNVVFNENKNKTDVLKRDCSNDSEEAELRIEIEERNPEVEEINSEVEEIPEEGRTSFNRNREHDVRKRTRIKRKPQYMNDFFAEDEFEHLALNSEICIDDTPKNFEEIEGRSDCNFWRKAINNEMESLKLNETWIEVEKPKHEQTIKHQMGFPRKKG